MRLKIWALVISLAILALSACQAAESAITETVLVTETKPLHTSTITPSLTARILWTSLTPAATNNQTQPLLQTATPEPNPTATQPIFVRDDTPIPPSVPITAENADQLTELARLGRGRIVDVQLSPDRNYLLVQTPIGIYGYLADEQLELWRYEAASGIAAVALPRLERWMAVADHEGQITFLIYKRGSMFTRWDTGYDEIKSLAFSYDDMLLAAVGDQGVTVWRVGETEPLYRYPDIWGDKVRFTPDGESLIVSNVSQSFWYTLSSGEFTKSVNTIDGSELEYSPDGTYFTDGGSVWKANSGEFQFTVAPEEGIPVFSPDSNFMAILRISGDEKISIWRVTDGEKVLEFRSPFNKGQGVLELPAKRAMPADQISRRIPYFTGMDFSPDGNHLAAATSDDFVELWNLNDGKLDERIPSLGDHLFFRKSSRLVVWGYNSLLQIDPIRGITIFLDRDFNSLRYDELFVHDPVAERKLLFSKDGEWLFAENIVWHFPDGRRSFRLGEEVVLADSEGGDLMYTFNNVTDIVHLRRVGDFAVDGEVELLPPAVEGLDLTPTDYLIENMVISPNGRYFSGYIRNYGLVTWDLQSGLPITDLYDNTYTYGGDYSPNNRFLYTWGEEGLKINRLDTYEKVFRLIGNYTSFDDILYFTEDGKYLLVSENGISEYQVFDDHLDKILQIDPPGNEPRFDHVLAISPDYSLIAYQSGSQLLLLNFKSGKMIVQIPAHLDEIIGIAFSPDGRYIATSSWDGTIRIWGIPVED